MIGMSKLLNDIMNYSLFIMWHVVYHLVLEKRYSKKITLLGEGICFVLYYIVPHLFEQFTAIRSFAGLLLMFAAPVFLYKGALWKRIIPVIANFLIMLASEMLCAVLAPSGFDENAVRTTPEGYILFTVYLLINACLLFGFCYYMRTRKDMVRKKDAIFVILFAAAVSALILECGLLCVKDYTTMRIHILIMFLCALIAVVSMWILLARFAKTAQEEEKNHILSERILDMKNYYKSMNEQYERIGRLRHDISNHMLTIRGLLAEGKTEDAKAYADKIEYKGKELFQLDQCRDVVVSSFLYHRFLELADSGIEIESNISIPDNIGIASDDLVVIYGNLLNNAEEAVSFISKPWIHITTDLKGDYLRILVENPYDPSCQEKEQRIQGLDRGYGIKILSSIAQSYQGTVEQKEEQDIYKMMVLLMKGGTDV